MDVQRHSIGKIGRSDYKINAIRVASRPVAAPGATKLAADESSVPLAGGGGIPEGRGTGETVGSGSWLVGSEAVPLGAGGGGAAPQAGGAGHMHLPEDMSPGTRGAGGPPGAGAPGGGATAPPGAGAPGVGTGPAGVAEGASAASAGEASAGVPGRSSAASAGEGAPAGPPAGAPPPLFE